MESSLKKYIKANLFKLIENTTTSTELLAFLKSKEILGAEDVQNIENSTLTHIQQAKKFYEIIFTKTLTYEALKEALEQSHQSGAVDILNQYNPNCKTVGSISYFENPTLGATRNSKVFKGSFNGIPVAVKRTSTELPGAERVLKEVEHLKFLGEHPHVVRYYHYEQKGSFIYIAIELCIQTLCDAVKNQNLKITATKVLRQCAKGIKFLHEKNIVHRDLKPTNILINKFNQIKISDFDLAKKISNDATFVEVSSVDGTQEWMAPEILKFYNHTGTRAMEFVVEKSADIFALGCIFYFVLSEGKHPFGDGRIERPGNILKGAANFQLNENNKIWEKVIVKMICTNPRERLTAPDLLLHITGIMENANVLQETSHDTQIINTNESAIEMPQEPGPLQTTTHITNNYNNCVLLLDPYSHQNTSSPCNKICTKPDIVQQALEAANAFDPLYINFLQSQQQPSTFTYSGKIVKRARYSEELNESENAHNMLVSNGKRNETGSSGQNEETSSEQTRAEENTNVETLATATASSENNEFLESRCTPAPQSSENSSALLVHSKNQGTPLAQLFTQPEMFSQIKSLFEIYKVNFESLSEETLVLKAATAMLKRKDFHELVKILSDNGPTFRNLLTHQNVKGQNSLHLRLSSSRTIKCGTIELFIAAKQDMVTEVDANGNNLFLAAVKGRKSQKVLSKLKASRVHVDTSNNQGENALHLAVRNYDKATLRYLLGIVNNKQKKNSSGKTPLDLAQYRVAGNHPSAIYKLKEMIEILQKHVGIGNNAANGQ